MLTQNRLVLCGLVAAWMLSGGVVRANDLDVCRTRAGSGQVLLNPCIEYQHRGRPICCCDCTPVQTTLQVTDPCTCCTIGIPVCLPGCCNGCPNVCSRCPILFNREVVKYEYCCGVTVVIKVSKCGDILVTYWHA